MCFSDRKCSWDQSAVCADLCTHVSHTTLFVCFIFSFPWLLKQCDQEYSSINPTTTVSFERVSLHVITAILFRLWTDLWCNGIQCISIMTWKNSFFFGVFLFILSENKKGTQVQRFLWGLGSKTKVSRTLTFSFSFLKPCFQHSLIIICTVELQSVIGRMNSRSLMVSPMLFWCYVWAKRHVVSP